MLWVFGRTVATKDEANSPSICKSDLTFESHVDGHFQIDQVVSYRALSDLVRNDRSHGRGRIIRIGGPDDGWGWRFRNLPLSAKKVSLKKGQLLLKDMEMQSVVDPKLYGLYHIWRSY